MTDTEINGLDREARNKFTVLSRLVYGEKDDLFRDEYTHCKRKKLELPNIINPNRLKVDQTPTRKN